MRLILSNDDGFDAIGIQTLWQGLSAEHATWMVAPAGQQSAKSHAFTMHDSVRVVRRGNQAWAVEGTPVDCAYVALYKLVGMDVDWMVSGINRGSNLGSDVLYSGTVAAATEAVIHGVPSIAVSLCEGGSPAYAHYETALEVVKGCLSKLPGFAPTGGALCWNINVPNVPMPSLKGVRVAPLARREYAPKVKQVGGDDSDMRVMLGGDHVAFHGSGVADGPLLEEGYATITPLNTDWTHREVLSGMPSGLDLAGLG
jgi:5'-nucleotidase